MSRNILFLLLLSFLVGCSSKYIPDTEDPGYDSLVYNGGIAIPTESVLEYRKEKTLSAYERKCREEEKRNCSQQWLQNVKSWSDKGYDYGALIDYRKKQLEKYPHIQ